MRCIHYVKITKQALKKIKCIEQQHPDIFKLFPSSELFKNTVINVCEGPAQIYGFSKVLAIYIKVIIQNDEVEYKNAEEFIKKTKQWLNTEIYNTYEKQDDDRNFIKMYFNDVGKIYKENNDFKDEIDFIPENRDLFIKSNLKLVVSTAKRYMGLGVPFEDLIGAGNVGLCEAFDKFKAERNTIRADILADIEETGEKTWTPEEVREVLQKYYTYGNILEKLCKKVRKTGFATSKEFSEWTLKHIKPAVFASVAFMWIRAYILIEVNKNATIVKLPKEATEEMAAKTHFISVEEYNSQDDNPDFDIPSDDYEEQTERIDTEFKQIYFKETVQKMLSCLEPRARRIVIKKFGIGLPWPMRINEIAEDEDISPSRCTIAFKEAIDKILENMTEEQKADVVHYLHFD